MSGQGFDQAIRRLAASQHGVFTLAQAAAAGMTAGMPKRRVDRGEWIRLSRSVMALAGSPDTWLRSVKAGELSVDGAAIIGRPALELYRLPAGRRVRPIIAVGRNASSRNDLARVHRTRRPPATRWVDGIRTATPEEALLYAAGHLDGIELERNVDDAMLRGLVRYTSLARLLDVVEPRRQRGYPLLRPLVDERRPGWVMPESVLETILGQVLRSARIPPFARQVNLPWLENQAQRVDVLIPDWRLILEADGRHWHARLKAFELDRKRDNLALANGYGVMRFTSFQLLRCRAEVVQLIESAGTWRQSA